MKETFKIKFLFDRVGLGMNNKEKINALCVSKSMLVQTRESLWECFWGFSHRYLINIASEYQRVWTQAYLHILED